MNVRYCMLVTVTLMLAGGCASNVKEQARREVINAEIATILETPVAAGVDGVGAPPPAPTRCLSEMQFRSFRPLDSERILFVGRNDKLWLNTLRGRCPELRFSDVLVTRSFSSMRLCRGDTFIATDWFDWPWYRRWPWRWGGLWTTGATCTLGDFQEISAAQLEAIEATIDSRR